MRLFAFLGQFSPRIARLNRWFNIVSGRAAIQAASQVTVRRILNWSITLPLFFFVGSTLLFFSTVMIVTLSNYCVSLTGSVPTWWAFTMEYFIVGVKILSAYAISFITIFSLNHLSAIPDFIGLAHNGTYWFDIATGIIWYSLATAYVPIEGFIRYIGMLPNLGWEAGYHQFWQLIIVREVLNFPYTLWVLVKAVPTLILTHHAPTWLPEWLISPIIEGIAISVASSFVIQTIRWYFNI